MAKKCFIGRDDNTFIRIRCECSGGFATTSQAFIDFLAQTGLDDKINQRLKQLDVDDVKALAQAGQ